jgi:hypothetical protein
VSGIILSTKAIGTATRTAYFKYFTHKEVVKNDLGIEKTVRTRMQQRVPECQSVIFICPARGCGKKNNQSILNARAAAGDTLSFNCCRCGREIEVSKPAPERPGIIVPGITAPKPMSLVGLDGQPLSR